MAKFRVSVSCLNGYLHPKPATARVEIADEDLADFGDHPLQRNEFISEILRETAMDLYEWDWEEIDG